LKTLKESNKFIISIITILGIVLFFSGYDMLIDKKRIKRIEQAVQTQNSFLVLTKGKLYEQYTKLVEKRSFFYVSDEWGETIYYHLFPPENGKTYLYLQGTGVQVSVEKVIFKDEPLVFVKDVFLANEPDGLLGDPIGEIPILVELKGEYESIRLFPTNRTYHFDRHPNSYDSSLNAKTYGTIRTDVIATDDHIRYTLRGGIDNMDIKQVRFVYQDEHENTLIEKINIGNDEWHIDSFVFSEKGRILIEAVDAYQNTTSIAYRISSAGLFQEPPITEQTKDEIFGTNQLEITFFPETSLKEKLSLLNSLQAHVHQYVPKSELYRIRIMSTKDISKQELEKLAFLLEKEKKVKRAKVLMK
jgi:hypothetical protein